MIAVLKQYRAVAFAAALWAVSSAAAARFDPPPLPPPSKDADVPVEIAAQPIAPKRVIAGPMAMLGNESTYYYQAGGGSLLAGLLLGPAGVAINARNVKQRTQREAADAASKEALDPRRFLAEPFARYNARIGASAAPAAGTAKVTPYLIYVRAKKADVVYRMLSFDVEYAGWTGRYTYHYTPLALERFQASPDAGQAEAFADETARAADSLLGLFNAEARGQVGPVEIVQVVSAEMTPLAPGAKMPMGLRGEFQGRPVLLGAGTPDDGKARVMFNVGAHLFADGGFEILKRKGQAPQP